MVPLGQKRRFRTPKVSIHASAASMPQRNLTKGHNLAPSLMNITPQYSPTDIYKPTKGARRHKKGECTPLLYTTLAS